MAGQLASTAGPHLPPISGINAAAIALAHRGPDDSGCFEGHDLGIALAHTRLSILDLSGNGRQPMRSDDGRVVLVFNGEIYNFADLRQQLGDEGVRFDSRSDTEVILRVYEQWRPETEQQWRDFLGAFNGIFALAIWDDRRRELVVARDALGVKPLYYVHTEDHFAFASELKALRPLVGNPVSADAVAVDQYLSFLWTPGERTLWPGAIKLDPGSLLRVRTSGEITRSTWYRLPGFRRIPRSKDTAAQLAEQTAACVRQAVHRQMVSDVPLGAFLSGGLDSSSVVAFAREVDPHIRCFTIETPGGTDAGFVDDLPYARRVAQHLGVNLDVVRVDARNLATEIEEMVWHLDEPLADPAPLNVLHISRAARQWGIKVLLSGAGGDDLFTGYRRHLALLRERYWSWLPEPVRRGLQRMSLHLDARTSIGRRVRKAFAGADLDGDERIVSYFRWLDDRRVHALLSPALRAEIAESRPEQPMLDFLADLPTGTPPLERMLALEQRFFLAAHNLTYTDKMSMAVGVEVRVPFLDLDLVEFAATIPPHLKQRGGCGKWILKEAMSGILPHDVIHRPKVGFGAPLERWVRHDLREWIHDLLSESTLRRRGLFDPAAVSRLLADNDAGRVHAPYTILSLACIEVWCRRFIDHRQEVSSDAAAIH
ncbi:MAG: asparagine synthase (glutamine-hydrolyzing) [Nitrospira sp.]|nr:asparagine synthase (glutamine-hydrolyzing) [Nitrospira sp.]